MHYTLIYIIIRCIIFLYNLEKPEPEFNIPHFTEINTLNIFHIFFRTLGIFYDFLS